MLVKVYSMRFIQPPKSLTPYIVCNCGGLFNGNEMKTTAKIPLDLKFLNQKGLFDNET